MFLFYFWKKKRISNYDIFTSVLVLMHFLAGKSQAIKMSSCKKARVYMYMHAIKSFKSTLMRFVVVFLLLWIKVRLTYTYLLKKLLYWGGVFVLFTAFVCWLVTNESPSPIEEFWSAWKNWRSRGDFRSSFSRNIAV